MKNKLLITTALVALFSASNVSAEVIIDKDNSNIYHESGETRDKYDLTTSDLADNNLTVNGNNNLTAYAKDSVINVSDGKTITLNQGRLHANKGSQSSPALVISGGTVNVNGPQTEENNVTFTGEGILISDGTVNLNGGNLSDDAGFGFNMTGGNINMKTSEDSFAAMGSEKNGSVNITGGKITVDGGIDIKNSQMQGSNFIQGANINIKGGELNINSGANLKTINRGDKSTINLTDDGVINLSGGVLADISGNGNLNIKSSDALVEGNVSSYSKLSFDANHSLSKAISGTIGYLSALNVNNGTLTYDKETRRIGDLSVKGQLDINEEMRVSNDFNLSEGTINLNNNLQFYSAVNLTGGTININESSREERENGIFAKGSIINVNGGTINMNKAYLNTYDNGAINLNDGSINVLSSQAAQFNTDSDNGNAIITPEFNIKGGELNITENSGIAIGTVTGVGADETIQKGIINLTDAGIINLNGILLADISGNGNLNIKSSDALVEGNVSDSKLSFDTNHSLSKAISGTIGDLAALNVNKGTLVYDKATGAIGNLTVAGALDIGTNTIEATNVDFKDNSKLALRVSGADNYGKIDASTINIGKDTTMNVTLDNGVVDKGANTKFKFLNGMVTGDFENKIAENNRYDIEWTEDGYLSVTGKASASDVASDIGGSAANAATAEAWDSINSSSSASEGAKAVASTLNELSQNATDAAGKQAYIDALTAVAPEVAPMVQQTSAETANQVFGAVGTRLSGGSISTGGEGMASGDNVFERAAMWVQGLFNKSKLDDTSKAKGFDADTNGLALGFEKFVTDDVKAGVGYAYSKTDIDGFMRDTDVDTHTALLYGEYKPSNWYVNGIATYGWSDYSEKKNVAGVNVKADYDVETFGLQAMTGYDMNVNGFGLTPEAGLRYVHIKQDAYKDSADQRVSAIDSDILTGVIGAKVSKSWELSNGMNIRPKARIAATYDLFNDDVNSVVTLANGSAYAVKGEALDRFGMEFGAGVTAEINDKVELSLGYEGKFRQDYQDHTGLLNVKYKF